MLHCRSNCSLARAMDGRTMCPGIISSCHSAATSEISLTHVISAIASTRPLHILRHGIEIKLIHNLLVGCAELNWQLAGSN